MNKPAITIFAPILFALAGLFFIATGFLPVDEIKNTGVSSQTNNSDSLDFSPNFKRFETSLLN